MRRSWWTLIALLLAALWAPLTSRASGETPINSYTVVALGDLGGGYYTNAYGLNDSGQVVGSSRPPITGITEHAFLWQNGVMTDLGTLGGADSRAQAVNNAGQVVGWANTAGGGSTLAGAVRAFLWDAANGMQNLGTLGGNVSRATGINDAGQVVGWSSTASGTVHAFLWRNGQMLDLGVPAGYVHCYGSAVNPSGQVAGWVVDAYGQARAFRWTPTVPNGTTGTMIALEPSPSNHAYGINAAGDVVGDSAAAGSLALPTLWSHSGGARALPFVNFMDHGVAYGVNDAVQVVGQNSYDYWDDFGNYTYNYAFLWDAGNGTRELGVLTGGLASFDQATAINASGQVIANTSGSAYVLNPSPVPTRPSLGASIGDTRVTLSWNASSGAPSYTVKRAAASGGPYATLAPGVTGTTYTDTAVLNGYTYYYVVCAVNAYGESGNSNEVTAVPNPPPSPPAGLTAIAGDQQVSLSWSPSAGADGYYLWGSTTQGGPYVPVASMTDIEGYPTGYPALVTATTYLDDGRGWGDYAPLANGRTYYYVVTAVSYGYGESGYSNQASATPMPPPPPPAPTGLSAIAGDRRVSLSWTGSPGATYYDVQRSNASGGPYTSAGSLTTTSLTDYDVANGTTYYYVVYAGNSGGRSPNSNQVSATPTGPPPPAAPTNLTATAGKKRVTLQWRQSASAGVTQNRIYRATTSGGPYALRATISASTSYADTSVTSGATYYYVVTAVNSSGKESAYSNQAVARPK